MNPLGQDLSPTHRRSHVTVRPRLRALLTALLCGAMISGAAGSSKAAHRTEAGRGRPATVVRTDAGLVEGGLGTDTRMFQGIPYAAPPVGHLRWASPQPAASWSGVRSATEPGNRCAQAAGLIDQQSSTEDCLYLNVTTPVRSSTRALPVMVWIHGNGYINGAGSLYDAQRLARTGKVIVVSFNYRLGVFGFLDHPALDHGPAKHLSGNFGLEDQQAALRWVQRNAAAFGGDPANVTLFGESAGGTSICAHLVAPESAGLFHQAILQSAQCTGRKWSPGPATWFPLPRAERERHGLDVAAKVGCSALRTAAACLRAKPVEELVKWSDSGLGSGPAVGGGMLPMSPEQAFATGHFRRVPIIQGTTRDEHRLFTAAIEAATGETTTDAGYRQEIQALFAPADAARVLARYPADRFRSPGEALSTVVTDWAWGCTVLDRDRTLDRHVPTYAYEFDDDEAPWFSTLKKPNFPTGAFHGSELQYLFDDEQLPGPATPAQHQLADTMMRYWARFAHTGDPNGPGAAPWPRFGTGRYVQSLRPGRTERTDLAQEHQCGFWNTIAN
ncbi:MULTISPECIES: carboxylesterase/lipase family protein [Streptomyces]|uniref:Carboxylic ester hydrolase n=1 Tax=Streptomyces sviceus (strain ATCC 29083 / DSM 924 / JCM 4929 / NBRC 13980 / NCIMB 11184 / NRRL 5439 / UC 5370) TaxID=463191 RepID=B5HPI0_STRX2|nr:MULTISPECIES: carboxylesterase/lipase family protein [Streptomyces]EDY54756.1 carboxylesterase [Streptomyces sviceus ATCC 29083]